MKKTQNNFQDLFLNSSRKKNIPVAIHLMNGFQLRGLVKGFDPYTVILESDDKLILVYKHAITTVTPSKNISLAENHND